MPASGRPSVSRCRLSVPPDSSSGTTLDLAMSSLRTALCRIDANACRFGSTCNRDRGQRCPVRAHIYGASVRSWAHVRRELHGQKIAHIRRNAVRTSEMRWPSAVTCRQTVMGRALQVPRGTLSLRRRCSLEGKLHHAFSSASVPTTGCSLRNDSFITECVMQRCDDLTDIPGESLLPCMESPLDAKQGGRRFGLRCGLRPNYLRREIHVKLHEKVATNFLGMHSDRLLHPATAGLAPIAQWQGPYRGGGPGVGLVPGSAYWGEYRGPSCCARTMA